MTPDSHLPHAALIVHHAWDDFIACYEKHHRRAMGRLRPDAVRVLSVSDAAGAETISL